MKISIEELGKLVGELKKQLHKNLSTQVKSISVSEQTDISPLVQASGGSFDNDNKEKFILNFFGEELTIQFPEIDIKLKGTTSCPEFIQTLILYYLINSFNTDKSPTGKWINFRELEDGMTYEGIFQNHTSQLLIKHFNDFDKLVKSAKAIGGIPRDIADASFVFYAFPKLPMLLTCWRGDDEFPPAYNLLFDETANNFMPTHGCTLLGRLATSKLISKSSYIDV